MQPPDIFLSYNREDQARAKVFAEAFEAQGFNVWWDADLKSGEAYDEVTETALRTAKAVVVLWSKKSVVSRWVRAEATLAHRNKTLVPCMIEACDRPIMFELTQTAELGHWRGETSDVAWAAFVADVQRLVEKDREGIAPAKPSSAPEALEPAAQPAPQRLWGLLRGQRRLASALVAMVVLGLGGWLGWRALDPGTGAPTGQPASQRIAFFGFTPAGIDPLATDIAATATNETIQAFLALRLETASRTDTQGVELAQQLEKAAELGAAYALGGEVRPAGGGVTIQMHLEDVATRTTLWEQTVSGAAADKASLPVLAAGAATRVTRCMAGARPSLPRQDGDLLAQLATACATPFIVFRDAVPRWRALAAQAPDSAVIQANLGNSLLYHANHAGLAAAELREVWKEATTAAQRALAIEPDNGVARTVLAYNAIFEGRPLSEAGKLMDEAVTVSPDDWRRGETGSNRNEFLQGVGRNAESLAAARAVIDRDPLSPTPYSLLAQALLRLGRGPEAGRILEQMSARWPDAWWETSAFYAFRYGISDIEVVLAAAPRHVSADSKTCWRQLAQAYASSSPSVRSAGADVAAQCGADGRIDTIYSGVMRDWLLGDVAGVLELYGVAIDRNRPSNFLWNAAVLLGKDERAFRADPQFLPLMKKSGIYQYWLDAGTHPDICDLPEEQDFEVCASLRADQAGK